jgi:hypothetical protein
MYTKIMSGLASNQKLANWLIGPADQLIIINQCYNQQTAFFANINNCFDFSTQLASGGKSTTSNGGQKHAQSFDNLRHAFFIVVTKFFRLTAKKTAINIFFRRDWYLQPARNCNNGR